MDKKRRRIAIGIQYDGSPYCGWQSQINQATVQDHIEGAITKFIGDEAQELLRLTAAGRTDTGVHALGQVAHFDTDIDRPDWSWVRGLNSFLPFTISIQWAKEVTFDFDARRTAYERSYVYFLMNSPIRTPLLHGKAGYNMLPLAKLFMIDEMRLAAQSLLGEHDFTCFRSSECQSRSPIKTIYQLDIVQDGARVFFLLRANAFLHHMVRNIIGTLLQVGIGKKSVEWVQEVLQQRDRSLAAPTFSADGLYLAKVSYPEHFQIPMPNLGQSAIPEQMLNQAFCQSFPGRVMS